MASSSSNTHPMAEQPPGFKVQLFPHQRTSIYHMEERERLQCLLFASSNTTIHAKLGILADMPGYGKSFSILGLIARDKMEWGNEPTSIFYSSERNSVLGISRTYTINRIRTNLIVTTLSTLHQWVDYVKMTSLTYYVVDSKASLKDIDASKYDVIFVSPTFYKEFANNYAETDTAFKRVIYDEPVNNYISGMTMLQAGFYWLMCATWGDITLTYSNGGRQHMMRRILDGFHSPYVKYLVVKNDDAYVKSSFVMPMTHYHTYKCISPVVYNAISQYVSKDVLTMIDAGNIKGAIQHLGGSHTNGNLIDIVIQKQKDKYEQARHMKAMYDDKIKKATEANNPIEKATAESQALWAKKMDEYAKNMEEIKQKYAQVLEEDCAVCADTLQSPIMTPCCQHIFCGSCIVDWVRKKGTCITCRAAITLNSLVIVNEKEGENEKEKKPIEKKDRPMTRQETVVSLLKDITSKNNQAKIIMFSEYDETFAMIKDVLQQSNLAFKECKGTRKTREKVLREFKVGAVPVLFLNARYNGAGINLQDTTDIILYHEMGDTTKTQIIGRANRLGRVGELHVHTLIN